MKYNLKITEEQAKIIKIALEEYIRIRMDQFSDLADDLVFQNFVYNKSDPENSKKFQERIDRRDSAILEFHKALLTAQPERKTSTVRKTEDMLVAEDIWRVIRHQLYLDQGRDPHAWCVDADEPFRQSKEPLPEMKKMSKD